MPRDKDALTENDLMAARYAVILELKEATTDEVKEALKGKIRAIDEQLVELDRG